MNVLTDILNNLISWLWMALQWLWNFYISIPFIKSLPSFVQLLIFVVVVGGAVLSGIRHSMGGGHGSYHGGRE
jgi:hypothetical protein